MLKLRELERRDMSTINAWRSQASLIRLLGAPYRFIGPEIDETWFDSYLSARGNTVRCVTVDDSEDVPLCLSTLSGIDWVNRSCIFSIMVGEDANRGKGIGTFSVNAMLDHAFDDLNLNRVELGVLEGNARARHVYEKCGFRIEGLKREATFKCGRYEDMLVMAVLRSEWKTLGKPSV